MGLSEGKRVILDSMVFQKYQEALVFGALANREYEQRAGGQLQKYESVKILEVEDLSASEYTGTCTYTDVDAAAFELKVDQSYYVAKKQDDLDKIYNNEQLLSQLVSKIGQALGDKVDTALAGLYSQAGNTYGDDTTAIALTAALTVSNVTLATQALKENNVTDMNNIVAVVPPWFESKLKQAGVKWDTNNSDLMVNGRIGRFLGVDFYVSNNIQRKAGQTGGNFNKIMFFVRNNTIALAEYLTPFEQLRLIDEVGNGWRQVVIYGTKVVRPSSLYTLTATETAETAI